MQPDYVDVLKDGATLVTGNARLARDLRRGYDEHCRNASAMLWEAPDIIPWGEWLKRSWAASAGLTVLLGPLQERFLWERIISRASETRQLLDVPATAAAAADAYAIAASWELPLSASDCYGFDDAAAFVQWAVDFDRTLDANNWTVRARLAAAVVDMAGSGRFPPPRRLLYAGFDELNPAQRRLLEALARAGCRVEALEPPAPGDALASRTGLPDTRAEIAAAAKWARSLLSREPAARVGVVLADLAAARTTVERLFEDELHPSCEPAPATRGRLFHVSSGTPLVEIPLVAAALRILGLRRSAIPLADAGVLLRSPFLAGAEEERGSRGLLEVELRRRGLAEVPVSALGQLAAARFDDGSPRPYHCPVLGRRLRGLQRLYARLPEQAQPATWSRIFSRLLRAAGWPGDRTLNSTEYQSVESWNEALSEFAALDLMGETMTCAEALARVRRLAREKVFTPADEGAPVQIQGMLEAAGSTFDYLWIAGLEDRQWPAAPSPNPFLPPPTQRKQGVPHSSAEREMAWARGVTERLLKSAREVVVSYPLRDGDTDLRPSPLIMELPDVAPDAAGAGLSQVLRGGGAPLEEFEDAAGPPLSPGAVPRGGMGIFERQAACPFSAFAQYRLGARPLEEPLSGLSPQDRGNVLHAALDNLWRELGSHAALVALSLAERQDAVRRSVAAAIEAKAHGRGVESLVRLKALEQERLERLLAEWLDVEAAREPFVVAGVEQARRVEVGGLMADIRMDRVDRLLDGREIVIDYKTSAATASPGAWEGDRPDKPQLPLYAAKHTSPVAGVLFAQVVPGALRFRGLGENAGVPGCDEYARSKPGKEAGDTLAEHIAAWGRTLETLGAEFVSGVARVAPKRPATCESCHLGALCRVAELRAAAGGEAGEEPNE